ncbi:MAG: DUF6048 family protein [Bacteroidales bacterium]
MIRISGYIISIGFLMLLSPAFAQTEEDDQPLLVPPDTLYEPALRIGLNLVRPSVVFVEPSRFGLEAVADYNLDQEYFAVAEGGFSRRYLDEPSYNLKENGIFIRIGADRNFYHYLNDVIAVGARLGASVYERKAPLISVEGGYWDEYSGSLGSDTFFRQWAEVVVTLKTEIFSNIFVGWNLRGKLLLFDKKDRYMQDRYIPGFGGGTANSKAGFDFYIYYRFPLK